MALAQASLPVFLEKLPRHHTDTIAGLLQIVESGRS